LGRTAEYEAIYGVYSAWAHGDPGTSDLIRIGHGGIWHAFGYWAQILIQVADAKRIVLTGEHYELLVELRKGMTE